MARKDELLKIKDELLNVKNSMSCKTTDGSSSSGHYKHVGIPGHWGGSAKSGLRVKTNTKRSGVMKQKQMNQTAKVDFINKLFIKTQKYKPKDAVELTKEQKKELTKANSDHKRLKNLYKQMDKENRYKFNSGLDYVFATASTGDKHSATQGREQMLDLLREDLKQYKPDASDETIEEKIKIVRNKIDKIIDNAKEQLEISGGYSYKAKWSIPEYDEIIKEYSYLINNTYQAMNTAKQTANSIKEIKAGFDNKQAVKAAEAFENYTGSQHYAIRHRQSKEYAEYADLIDDVIYLSPKYDGTIYRGKKFGSGKENELKDMLKNLKAGKTMSMVGATSWTANYSTASSFSGQYSDIDSVIFRIKENKSAASVTHLSIFGSNEGEIMQPSTARYILDPDTEIEEYDKGSGKKKYIITLREINYIG